MLWSWFRMLVFFFFFFFFWLCVDIAEIRDNYFRIRFFGECCSWIVVWHTDICMWICWECICHGWLYQANLVCVLLRWNAFQWIFNSLSLMIIVFITGETLKEPAIHVFEHLLLTVVSLLLCQSLSTAVRSNNSFVINTG